MKSADPSITRITTAVYRFPTPEPEADGTLQWDATTAVTVTLQAGDKFDIKAFNDFVWSNGNVPIELQQKEWFGSADRMVGSSGEGKQ